MNEAGGRIELICGPMFSGKTTTLIRRLTAARQAGCAVLAVKPAKDVRCRADQIMTHDGVALAAENIAAPTALARVARSASVIGFDEAHFFDSSFVDACEELARRGARVIAAGVDLDHHGRPFDVMAGLRRIADEVTRLTSTCARCRAPARFTQRLIAGEERIIVGGAGDYEPRCARCFEPPG